LRLGVDLLGTVDLDKVDLVSLASWELKTGYIKSSLVRWDGAEEQVVQCGLGSHVSKVNVEDRWVGGNRGPGDLIGLAQVPGGVNARRGDGDGLSHGSKGRKGKERGERRHRDGSLELKGSNQKG